MQQGASSFSSSTSILFYYIIIFPNTLIIALHSDLIIMINYLTLKIKITCDFICLNWLIIGSYMFLLNLWLE